MYRNNKTCEITIAAKKGSIDDIKRLVKRKSDCVHDRDQCGWTALHYAASNNNIDIVEYLLQVHPDSTAIDCQTSSGMTPLFLASFKGNEAMIEYLIENGANPRIQDDKGDTALHIACYWGHAGAIKLLLANCHSNFNDILSVTNNRKLTPRDVNRGDMPTAHIIRGSSYYVWHHVLIPEDSSLGFDQLHEGRIDLVRANNTADVRVHFTNRSNYSDKKSTSADSYKIFNVPFGDIRKSDGSLYRITLPERWRKRAAIDKTKNFSVDDEKRARFFAIPLASDELVQLLLDMGIQFTNRFDKDKLLDIFDPEHLGFIEMEQFFQTDHIQSTAGERSIKDEYIYHLYENPYFKEFMRQPDSQQFSQEFKATQPLSPSKEGQIAMLSVGNIVEVYSQLNDAWYSGVITFLRSKSLDVRLERDGTKLVATPLHHVRLKRGVVYGNKTASPSMLTTLETPENMPHAQNTMVPSTPLRLSASEKRAAYEKIQHDRQLAHKKSEESFQRTAAERIAEDRSRNQRILSEDHELRSKRMLEDKAIAQRRKQEDENLSAKLQQDITFASSGSGKVVSAVSAVIAKSKRDRIDALNLIEDTMREEITFVKNDKTLTPEGNEVVSKVADILLRYPELQLYIEGHTNCMPGNCDPECKLKHLSQARVDTVRDALDEAGCKNLFMTKGYGCKHPTVGAQRSVRIFPEDLDYKEEEEAARRQLEEAKKKIEDNVEQLKLKIKIDRQVLFARFAAEDASLVQARKAEDTAISAMREADHIRMIQTRGRQDRIDMLNLIEDTMREDIEFVKNDFHYTSEGDVVVRRVAEILLNYPELQIHIESHTSCMPGYCDPECKLIPLSQARVDNVRDVLIAMGCKNIFMTAGWGCKHPVVGAERVVKIFPEDLEYESANEEIKAADRKALIAAKAHQKAKNRMTRNMQLTDVAQLEDRRIAEERAADDAKLAQQRAEADAAMANKFQKDIKAAKTSGKIYSSLNEVMAKAKKDRIDALNLIEDTMSEEITFVKNDDEITPQGREIVLRVANVLLRYPELQIHIQGHTSCMAGYCVTSCKLMELCQTRVDNVRDALVSMGCKNTFIPKGFGCKHPTIGAERAVKIFPEDLDYQEEERQREEMQIKARETMLEANEKVQHLIYQMRAREDRLRNERVEYDARRAMLRKAEDEEKKLKRLQHIHNNHSKLKQDRIDMLNLIEDTMQEDIEFNKNDKEITPEGLKICRQVGGILKRYPELQIHIEGHTACVPGHCNSTCQHMDLSQARVDRVRDFFIGMGCKNVFVTAGFGCKHPDVGAVRTVKIFPEDLDYD